jgi:hypothetical protein
MKLTEIYCVYDSLENEILEVFLSENSAQSFKEEQIEILLSEKVSQNRKSLTKKYNRYRTSKNKARLENIETELEEFRIEMKDIYIKSMKIQDLNVTLDEIKYGTIENHLSYIR